MPELANVNPYLGAKHLSSAGEMQRVANFLVQIEGLPLDVSFLIRTFPLPSSENEVLEVKYGNSKIKLPGPASYDGGDMTIFDLVDKDTEKVLSDWRKQVFNPETDAIGDRAVYAKTGYITEFKPDGTSGRRWKLEDIWPNKFNPGELSNDSSDLKSMTLSLVWDRGYRI